MAGSTAVDSPRREALRLVRLWGALLLLLALEFGASFLPLGRAERPFVMVPGVLMILVVAVGFMEVTKGIVIVRAFAVIAVFWLAVLLGLGSVDALTRIVYGVQSEAGTRVP